MVHNALTPDTPQHLAIVKQEDVLTDLDRMLHTRGATAAYLLAKLAALDEIQRAGNALVEGLITNTPDDPACLRLRNNATELGAATERAEQRLRGLKRRAEAGTISIATVGLSGAGKSSFINTAAGTYLLPSHGGDQVSGPVVRVRHDPTATGRRAVITYEGDRPTTLYDHDIDRAITQFDEDGTPNPAHRQTVDAEIQATFLNPIAKIATFIDPPGVIAGSALDEDRMVRSIEQDCDVMLVIAPIPTDSDRSVMDTSHHRIHALMAEVPFAFIVLNTWPKSERNTRIRRQRLLELGIANDRILTADCANTTEVNDVLIHVYRWLLNANRQQRGA